MTRLHRARKRLQVDTDDRWKQIAPTVPDEIRDIAVNNQKLYIATQRSGIFHISLEAQP